MSPVRLFLLTVIKRDHMNKILYVSVVWVVAMSVYFFDFGVLYAETRVPESNIIRNTIWDKSGSPYVLEGDVTVFASSTLTIGSGVEVIAGI